MKLITQLRSGRLARNTFWMIGVKVYQVAVNLVVSMLTARFLGPSNYGLINYAASLTALFTSLCTLGINSILVNELLHQRERYGKVLGSAIGLRLVSSLLSVITIVALAYALDPNETTTILVVLIYSTTLIFQCFDTLNYWYHANLNAKTAAVVAGIGYSAAAAYKVFLLVTQKSVLWFAASHVVEYALVAILLLFCYYRDAEKGQRLSFSFRVGKDVFSRSYHFILSGLMVAVYGQMDRVMLKSMLDETAVGFYSAAVAVTTMWPFVLSAIIDSVKPVILAQFGADRQRFDKYMTRLYGAIIYISFAAALAITVLSKYIILILYGQAYMEAQGALCILCWDTAFSYLGVARSTWLVPQGKQKYEKYIAACGALCNLALNAVMIPMWGVNGAALATLLTQIFTNFVVGFFFKEIRQNNVLILRGFCVWRYIK